LKKNKISKEWILKQRRDIYVRKSIAEGYRSRAVYKLEEIQKKFKIIKNGSSVVDLGAAPGSWSQFISRNFKNSKIVSIDLKDMKKITNINQIKGDFTDQIQQKKIIDYFGGKIDTIISDMAVNTTGNKNLDAIVTGDLCIEALNFSLNTLKKQGNFVSKIFMGSSFNEIVAIAKKNFKEVNVFKPPASRKDSKESFIICKILR
jgi:23S rRNA (uridine2552-2'-O)-methyltransferase|tara:strand:- start:1398 stop:2009 length:612 start_codon:yes stop_codon:yes gene_type:complete